MDTIRTELEKRLNTSFEQSTAWKCEVEELTTAYAAGMRDFRRLDLHGADLRGCTLAAANLAYANLDDTVMQDANLFRAYLERASLKRAVLTNANLTKCNLHHADLTNADLKEADLTHADLSGSYLNDADLRGANLHYAILQGLFLDGAKGLQAVGTLGHENSMMYAFIYQDVPRYYYKHICTSEPQNIKDWIYAKFQNDTASLNDCIAAVDYLFAWGKRHAP